MATQDASNISTNIFNKLPPGIAQGTGVDQQSFNKLIDDSSKGSKFGARVLTGAINVLNHAVGKTKYGGELVKYLEGKLPAKVRDLASAAQKTSQAANKLTGKDIQPPVDASNTNIQATKIIQQASIPEATIIDTIKEESEGKIALNENRVFLDETKAENTLSGQEDGSWILWGSRSSNQSFVSVKEGENVVHYVLREDKDFLDNLTPDKLITSAKFLIIRSIQVDSVGIQTIGSPKEAAPPTVGNLISNRDLEALRNHDSQTGLSGNEAEEVLKDQPVGTWVLRLGSDTKRIPSISIKFEDSVLHFRLDKPNAPENFKNIREINQLSPGQIRDIQAANKKQNAEALAKIIQPTKPEEVTPSAPISIPALELSDEDLGQYFHYGELQEQTEVALKGQKLQDINSLVAAGVTQVRNVPAPENGKITVTLAGETQALHANHVKTPEGNFIAAQVPGTRHDLFWKAAVDEASVIVDVSHPRDIPPYYPTGVGETYAISEHVSVTLNESTLDESDPNLVISKYTVKIDGKDHEMTRIHYQAWEDHSSTGTQALKNIVNVMNRIKGTSDKPPLIHCRAGVGRTGTVITTARILMQKATGKFDTNNPQQSINKMVVEGRVARGGGEGLAFVQKPSQYRTILEVGAE